MVFNGYLISKLYIYDETCVQLYRKSLQYEYFKGHAYYFSKKGPKNRQTLLIEDILCCLSTHWISYLVELNPIIKEGTFAWLQHVITTKINSANARNEVFPLILILLVNTLSSLIEGGQLPYFHFFPPTSIYKQLIEILKILTPPDYSHTQI